MSNQSVLQSGQVTPGHLASWTTDGVLQDAGAAQANQAVIASLRNANFNTTADQPIPIPAGISAFQITGIIVTNASIALNTVQGGFYPQASKGGTSIVAGSQSYSAITSAQGLLATTLTTFGANTRFSGANLGVIAGQFAVWLSLSVPQGATATADVYVLGTNLS